MDNSVSTLDDKLPSEMSLEDAPSGVFMSSKDGKGKEMRAPPTKTKTHPVDGKEIIPSQATQNQSGPGKLLVLVLGIYTLQTPTLSVLLAR